MRYFKYLVLLLCINFIFYFPINHLVSIGLLEIESNYRHLELGFDFDTFRIFYYLVLFFPLFEELSFRLFLIPKERNVRLGISFLFFITIYKVVTEIYDLNPLMFIMTTGSSGCAILLSYSLRGRFETVQYWLKSINKIYLLIISSSIFAFMHYGTNYSSDSFFISLIPLSKHFFSGMIFGIFRTRYGFVNGVILHALNNLLSFLAIFLG